MIKGMTGFGYAELSAGKITGAVEVKSVNHRYLDISYYLPMGFASIENKIRDFLQKRLERGKVTVSLKITGKPGQAVSLNTQTIKTYLQYARVLKKELGIEGKLSIAELIQLPGVVETRDVSLDAESLWPAVEKGIKTALDSLTHMRQREGKSLAADINTQLGRMLSQISKVKSRAVVIIQTKKKGLTEEEYLALQKNSDVNEEVARLIHHIEEFKALLKSNAAVGKKLDFIAQEMQRETNTIGSKLQDKIVSNAVIALKTKIEKIREQSQNIE